MCTRRRFLSTLSLRRATRAANCQQRNHQISIHALLAESDRYSPYLARRHNHFYPRSPCGERRPTMQRALGVFSISIHALLAESDAYGRINDISRLIFLSTLSLRRATWLDRWSTKEAHFYPRSPCGERPDRLGGQPHSQNFYPRSPCGERPHVVPVQHGCERISIHALLAESDFRPRDR